MSRVDEEDLINAKEAAGMLRCSRWKVYIMLRKDKLPGGFKLGGEWMIHRPTLIDWIQHTASRGMGVGK